MSRAQAGEKPRVWQKRRAKGIPAFVRLRVSRMTRERRGDFRDIDADDAHVVGKCFLLPE